MGELLELARKTLRPLKERFDEVVVGVSDEKRVMVKLWNTQPSVTQVWRDVTALLYLTKNRKIYMTSAPLSRLAEPSKLADEVSEHMKLLEESELYAPLPEPERYEPIEGAYDKSVVKAMEDPSDLVEAVVNAAVNEGVERVAGTLELSEVSYALVNSKGFEGVESKTEVMTYLRAFKGDFTGHWAFGSRRLMREEIERVGKKAAEYALMTNRKVDYEPGKYDLILSPLVVGNLMDLVASMASGMAIIMGFSMFMKNKPGDRVASEKFTLIDVPRDPELSGSTAFDEEGIATYDKPIIERGVLKTILHNVKTASKMRSRTTGNAGLLMPRAWSLRIPPGDSSLEEMIREVRKGILISNNWYTRLQNYVEGIFSTVSRDATLLIENGEVVGHLGRVRVSDRLGSLLNNVDLLGKEIYRIKWWEVRTPTKTPYLLCRGINVTKPFA